LHILKKFNLLSVLVKVLDNPKVEEKQMPKHKKNPDVGFKTTTYSDEFYLEFEDAQGLQVDEEVTLMDWGNVIVKNVVKKDSDIEFIEVALNLEGDFKKTKKKLTWLSKKFMSSSLELVNVLLLDYDYLITKKKLEEEDEIKDFLTPVTEFKVIFYTHFLLFLDYCCG